MSNASSSSVDISQTLHCSNTSEIRTSYLYLVQTVEVVVGLPGNLLALWIFCCRMKSWKPHTVFLLNLMIADLLLLMCVPFRIDAHLQGGYWVHGKMLCKINIFMLALNRSASIAFMTVVALFRYFKVCYPLHYVSLISSRHAIRLCLFIWAVVVILRIPLLTADLLHHKGNHSVCRSFNSYRSPSWSMTIHYVEYVTEFILSWILLLFCSARIIWYLKKQEKVAQQKKFKEAIRSVMVINLVFNVCFLPAVIAGLGALAIKKFDPHNCESFKKMSLAFMVGINLTYLNSTLDPVIYTFSSSMFRTALKSVFKRVQC